MIGLSDADRAKVQARLEDAEIKYHQLNTGTMARVIVDQNGEQVQFTAATRAGLYSYIQSLRGQLGYAPTNTASRPIRYFF